MMGSYAGGSGHVPAPHPTDFPEAPSAPPARPVHPPQELPYSAGSSAAGPTSYSTSLPPSERPRRYRLERVGVALLVLGFALLGGGVLAYGVGVNELNNISCTNPSDPYCHSQILPAENVSSTGIEAAGGGLILIGMGWGTNVLAHFDQSEERLERRGN